MSAKAPGAGESLRIGIDVGGTNTDAVLMCGRDVLASTKQATTADVTSGVQAAIAALLSESLVAAGDVRAVMVGTTHFVNAFVQRQALESVATVRIGLPMGSAIPPLVDWPEDLREVVDGGSYMVGGGAYYTGESYAPLDEEALRKVARSIAATGTRNIAVSSVFAPIRPDIELRAEEILRESLQDAAITLSHQVGGIGLIERENAAIINASLIGLAHQVVDALADAMRVCDLDASLYLSHNDGTLLDVAQVRRFPVFTCSAGPTNSIRGAAFLTGLEDAVVVDVGGTTTDVGVLSKGLARETSDTVELGGVKTNFTMPDVVSVALGGGTVVRSHGGGDCQLGPDSVGYRLREAARVFGGDTLTATDIAVASSWMDLGDRSHLQSLSAATTSAAADLIRARAEDAVDQVKTSAAPVPVVVVGGGGAMVREDLKGAAQVYRPAHGGVANAIGAAIAQVGGRVKRLFDYEALGGREAAIALATQEATETAIAAGALPDSVVVVEVEEQPMPYMETAAVELSVRVVGDMNLGAECS